VTKTSELGIFERGDQSRIELAHGKTLDNPYSMNVVDICPVGALTSRDFRFRARVWYLERENTVCGACANGCNIEMYHREGRLFRFQPRANLEVNDYWMCDAGRISIGTLQGEGRMFEVLVRGAGQFAPADWPSALASVAEGLQSVATTDGAVAIVVSAQATNEEIHLARRLGASLCATVAGISWSPPGAFQDDFLIKADKNPNTQGLVGQGLSTEPAAVETILDAVEAGTVKGLVLVRTDLTRWLDETRVRAALERVDWLVVLDTDGRAAAEYANVVLPIATYAETEGTFTNHAGRVQRVRPAVPPPGQARPGWQVLGDLVAAVTAGQPPASAAAVFDALAAERGAFAGLDHERVGLLGAPSANARANA
jgi:NADH-quinone oxidoreductase subunit G